MATRWFEQELERYWVPISDQSLDKALSGKSQMIVGSLSPKRWQISDHSLGPYKAEWSWDQEWWAPLMTVLGRLGPGQSGPGQLGPGARLSGAQLSAANWAPDNRAPGPNCPGPNCPPPKSGKLGPGQSGPGAQLSGAQLSAPQKWQIGPRTVGPQK